MRPWCAIVGFGVSLMSCLGAEPRVYSVCQVLDHLQDLLCREVRIEGRLRSDVDTWLEGIDCARPLVVNGVAFDHLLALTLLAGHWLDARWILAMTRKRWRGLELP